MGKLTFMKPSPKILFILKKRMTSHHGMKTISSGLFNSAGFVNKMLQKNGYDSHLVEVKDNNDIDREVTKFGADIVIIEALWVVPSKFEVLTKLHPEVKWIIRLHSEIPFIANEGIAMEWIYDYQKFDNVFVSVNSKVTLIDFNHILPKKTIYLPNYYPVNLFDKKNEVVSKNKKVLNVGCFGAIRPLKNQLYQATAAIQFANMMNKELHFHVNVARVENNGDPVLKNLRNLFKNNPKHKLVEHGWYKHDEFTEVVRKMDIGLQVSFTETFNIVAADFVNNNVPVIVSDEITWVSNFYKAEPTESKSIINKMYLGLFFKKFNLHYLSKIKLWWYSLKSEKEWVYYIEKQKRF